MAKPLTPAPLLGEPLPVELMNTIWADREGVHDALTTPEEAAGWISAISTRPEVSSPDLAGWLDSQNRAELAAAHESLRHLRDAARSLAARLTEDTRDVGARRLAIASAVETVNALASTAPTWPLLGWTDDGVPEISRASEAAPGMVLVADLARSATVLLAGGGGSDLRACQAPGCVLYFVKQHPRREWCSNACGNRARQARHYQRNRRQGLE